MSTEYNPIFSIGFYLNRNELKNIFLKGITITNMDEYDIDEILSEIVDKKLGLETVVLRDSNKGDNEYYYCLKIKPNKTRQSQYIFLEDLEKKEIRIQIDEKIKLFKDYNLTYSKPMIMASLYSF